MAIEITEEFAKEHNLTTEQVAAVTTFGNEYGDSLVADTKKEYDGLANKNAEAIISDVSKGYATITGIERNEGEKFKDYFTRGWDSFSKTEKEKLATATADYEAKVKDFKGDEATANELIKAKEALDALKLSTVDFDKYKEDSEKYTTLSESNDKLKLEVSFGQVKPVFPETVNTFEADKKWQDFKANILKDNTIELVDGEATVISKENEFKTEKLKDLVAKDETLSALLQGRKQEGTGAKQGKLQKIEGIPFEIPEGADGNTIQKAIETHLVEKGLAYESREFSIQFGKLYDKIREQKNA